MTMTTNEILKRQILYRSTHRGTKEMDLLLGNFVKNNIDKFDYDDLKDLEKLLFIEDEVIHKWYFEKKSKSVVLNSNVSRMLKNYKF